MPESYDLKEKVARTAREPLMSKAGKIMTLLMRAKVAKNPSSNRSQGINPPHYLHESTTSKGCLMPPTFVLA